MPSLVRNLPLLALLALAAVPLLHCGSSKSGVEPSLDAGSHVGSASASDAAPADAEADDAAADAGLGAEADDAAADASLGAEAASDAVASSVPEASAPDAGPLPCSIRTSGTDAGILDPTFQPFTWSVPPSSGIDAGDDFISGTFQPRLAVAPGGDAYVAVGVAGPGAPVNGTLKVVVMHVLASGVADPSFGGGGLVTLASWSALYDLIVDHNGDIVVTGTTPASASVAGAFGLVALHPDGSTDFTVDPIAGSSYCTGCIADGAHGYLALGPQGMRNIAPNGAVSETDKLPVVGEYFALCRMDRGASGLYLYCGYGGAGGGEAVKYDLDGVLVPSFGSGGAFGAYWDPMLDPWVAPDGSLFIADDALLDGASGPSLLGHLLSNGTVDPAYPTLSSVETAFPVRYAAPRCDGTELFVESGGAGEVMEVLGPSGPPLASGGAVAVAGGAYSYAIDSHGAVLALDGAGATGIGIELVRVLPSN